MKTFLRTPLLIIGLLVIGLASCKKSAVGPKPGGKNLVIAADEVPEITADNAFAIRLFKSLDSTNTGGANLFISPLSVSFALGMTSNGANGATLAAFKKTLNFAGLSQSQINDYYNNLITNLPQLDPNTTLDIANSIWYRQGFSVLPQFLHTDSTDFHAQAQGLDFSSASAPATINNWVNTNTHGFIPAIIKNIPGDAVMYLVNAMYFKSSWQEKFDVAQTHTAPFYLADNSTVQTSFMVGTVDFNFYNDGKAAVFELPYSNNKYSMVIVEPGFTSSLADITASLDSAQWQTWVTNLKPMGGSITLPKFKFSYGSLLNNSLINMGLGIAFSDNADFSLINPSTRMKISQVVHKAYVETDESGTTAAAATSVGVVALSAPAGLPPINHPFLFAIREKSSGIILFIGTVNNPTLSGD
jgi:serpin B